MAECQCLEKCPFFNDKMKESLPAMIELWKKKYCLGDSSECARFIVFQALGREKVPLDLYPHQLDRAQQLLMNNG